MEKKITVDNKGVKVDVFSWDQLVTLLADNFDVNKDEDNA